MNPQYICILEVEHCVEHLCLNNNYRMICGVHHQVMIQKDDFVLPVYSGNDSFHKIGSAIRRKFTIRTCNDFSQ